VVTEKRVSARETPAIVCSCVSFYFASEGVSNETRKAVERNLLADAEAWMIGLKLPHYGEKSFLAAAKDHSRIARPRRQDIGR